MVSRVLSAMFNPFYLPVIGLMALFTFSYLNLLPVMYKLYVLMLVYIFTVLLPTIAIRTYRNYHGWTPIELGVKERRMNLVHIPRFMGSIVVAALVIQVLCAMINLWWKVSTHSAAIGGVAGALIAFSQLFMFNPVWWLCLVFFVAGLIGTARMILRQHTLAQVVIGFLLGAVAAFIVILF